MKNVTFKDVVGLEDIKQNLRERLVEYYDYKDELLSNGYEPDKGMLLYGIPGTGKTMVAMAAINELLIDNPNVRYKLLDAQDIMSGTVSEQSEKISAIFRTLRLQNEKQKKDMVLVMDEIDLLLPNRNTRSVLAIERTSAFLKEIGGFNDDGTVYIIGTTNRPWDIDPAFLRSGRLKGIHVRPSDKNMRKGLLLQYVTSKIKIDECIDIDKLIEWTNGYVGSDFSEIGKQLFIVSKKKQKAGQDAIITPLDVVSVLTKQRIGMHRNLMQIARFEAEYTKFTQGKNADFGNIDDTITESYTNLCMDEIVKTATYAI